MPRTISDEEYAYLQGKRQTADLVEGLYNDPNYRRRSQQLLKEKYPNLPIPEFDLDQKIEDRFAQRDKKENDAAAEAKKKADDERYAADRARVQKQYGFTDEAMTRLEKTMVDKQVWDYDIAASWMAAREPKSSEAQWDNTRWNHEKQQGWGDIAKDPEAWGRSEIMGAIFRDQERARNG